ncbi:MAG: MopE-related protein [Myxococcota bacterium]
MTSRTTRVFALALAFFSGCSVVVSPDGSRLGGADGGSGPDTGMDAEVLDASVGGDLANDVLPREDGSMSEDSGPVPDGGEDALIHADTNPVDMRPVDACVVVDEVCDGVDNNCDGVADEGCTCVNGETRPCGSNEGLCEAGVQVCVAGVWGTCRDDVGPTDEFCDGADNDCDGERDNGLRPPRCSLTRGVCAGARAECGGTKGWLECGPRQYGAEYERTERSCDGFDNDCDGEADEGCAEGCSSGGSECAEDEICVCADRAVSCGSGGTCRSLFGTYRILIDSSDLPFLDLMDECWDANCRGPDQYVNILLNGVLLGRTATIADSFMARWPPAEVSAVLDDGMVLRLEVWDEDVIVDDPGPVCELEVSDALLRDGTFACGGFGTLRGRVVRSD